MFKLAYVFLWIFIFTIPWEASVLIPGLGTGPTGSGTIGKLVGLVAATSGVLAVLARGKARPLALFHILAGLFAIWVGVTSAWSIDTLATMKSLRVMVQVIAIPWLIWEVAGTPGRRDGLLQAYVLGGYVSVFNILSNYSSGIATKGSQLTTVDTGRFTAQGFNPNEIGFLLVLALPIAWQLSLKHQSTLIKWLNRAYLPLGTVAILLTGSRSSLIGAVMALCIVPLTLGRLTFGMKFGVLVIITTTLIGGALVVPQKTMDRLGTTTDEITSGTLNERRVIWKAGLELFLRHPIGGVGAGGFQPGVKQYLGYKKTAHNTYISVLVEEGVVGFIIFSLILISIYFHIRSAPPDERRFALVILATIVVGLLPRSWEFEKPLWLMFGFLLAPLPVPAMVHRARRWVPAIPRPAGAARRITGNIPGNIQ
jgi:O-antigen ligase